MAFLDVYLFDDRGLLNDIRALWPNPLLLIRDGRTLDEIGADIDAGHADVAPVAKWALANPDFLARLRASAPLNDPDPATFYAGGARGYTDYPTVGQGESETAEEAS